MDDPWNSPQFRKYYGWFLSLSSETLRRKIVGRCLVDLDQAAVLRTRERSDGEAAHNEKVLEFLRPGGLESFAAVLEILQEMGFGKKCEQLKAALPPGWKMGMSSMNDVSVRKVEDHLHSMCKHLSKMSDRMDLSSLDTDVRTCFIPLQAISEQEALRAMFKKQRHKGDSSALRGEEHFEEGKVFCLENVSQLLMRNPTINVTSREENAGSATAVASNCELESSCMLIGGAGQGKTTVCKRVLAQVIDADKGDFARFKLVFYVPCREVERVKSDDWCVLLGLNHASLGLDQQEQEAVVQHMSCHSGEVLILLDGIDEAGSDGFGAQSAALSLMQRNSKSRLLNATIIATSRPCQQTYDLVPTCSVRYRLRGFSEDQLRDYCRKQLGDEMGERCMEQLSEESNCPLKEAIRNTPLLCALLCHQYSITSSIPSSVTLFYTNFMRSAVSKLETRRGGKFGRVRLARDVSSHLHGGRRFDQDELVDISTVLQYQLEQAVSEEGDDTDIDIDAKAVELVQAFRCLYGLCLTGMRNGEASFQQESLSPSTRSACLNLGLLTDVSVQYARGDGMQRFSLVHLTVQEWCASRAIASTDNLLPIVTDCVQVIGVDEDTWVFWRFLFGALKEEDICSAMAAMESPLQGCNASVTWKKKMALFLMRCLLENQLSLHGDVFPIVRDIDLTQLPYASHYVSAASYLARDGANLRFVPLDAVDVMAVCNVVHLADHVKNLHVDNCHLSPDKVAMLSTVLDKAVVVTLSGNSLTGEPLERIAAELSKSTRQCLDSLGLPNCELANAEQDGTSLAECVRLPSLKTLWIGFNAGLGNEVLSSFANRVMRPGGLTELSVSKSNLRNGCGNDLATLVQKLPSLRKLGLSHNHLSDSDAGHLLSGLQSHQQIRLILIADNAVTDDLAPRVIEFLQARRTYEQELACHPNLDTCLPPCHIKLGSNDVTTTLLDAVATSGHCAKDVVDIGSHFVMGSKVHLVTIEELVEGNCCDLDGKLCDSMMSSLGLFLAGNNDVQCAKVRLNRISDSGAISLARNGLADSPSLRYICLNTNKIRITGTVAILKALASPVSGIRALSMEKNPVFCDVDTSSAEYGLLLELLSQCRHLRFIALGDTCMSDKIGADILHSLRYHDCISWIDMDENELGDDTALALVEMKTANTSLRRIGLAKNSISDTGVLHLLGSANVMAMEGVYLASNPYSSSMLRSPLLNATLGYTTDMILGYTSP